LGLGCTWEDVEERWCSVVGVDEELDVDVEAAESDGGVVEVLDSSPSVGGVADVGGWIGEEILGQVAAEGGWVRGAEASGLVVEVVVAHRFEGEMGVSKSGDLRVEWSSEKCGDVPDLIDSLRSSDVVGIEGRQSGDGDEVGGEISHRDVSV